MDQIVSRLADLTYEIFGLFIPGMISVLFLALWWFVLGPLAPAWTAESIPQLDAGVAHMILIFVETHPWVSIGLAVPLLYLLGHLLLWSSNSSATLPDGTATAAQTGGISLREVMCMRDAPPPQGYHERFKPLLDQVVPRFGINPDPSEIGPCPPGLIGEENRQAWEKNMKKAMVWRLAFPTLKSYLAEHSKSSLAATYQNKYTMHRSISLAAVVLAWLSLGSGFIALPLSCFCAGADPWRAAWLLILSAGATTVAWVFAQSHRYYWRVWGDTIVTESYAQLFAPQKK